ncbi:uncharacterized protein L969DRAFT_16199 [Mixia osmundae IAM 14324]|uniref:Uncharacterized protein n=1 Tax=Mixia osmundae (strain CBS 9802 / IAM 14324 / JCM 22182 / KY 12970) TaxID=764103 RepID=G7E5A0_MIXOS|nr:uncharacterized protein L969DRAFT_16199 [Mixia osmundae IAM 14324]KEI40841.1 hypothetical protein L969DRAFT_16199 [Mixia osmundae IAM 14324]GAA98010.1 hypothetical protein E5Q_04690 [Mixia osmundae IAM 14324]
MSGLISSIAWISQGKSARHPTKFSESDPARLGHVGALAKQRYDLALEQFNAASDQQNGGKSEFVVPKNGADSGADDEGDWEDEEADEVMETDVEAPKDPNDLSEYKLDEYDEDEEPAADAGNTLGAFNNIKSLQYHLDDADDPYLDLPPDQAAAEEEDEREELEILPGDNLIVTAKTQDDLSQIDVYLYDDRRTRDPSSEDTRESLYVHHDLLLPSMPLCLEWLDFLPHSPFGTSNVEAGAQQSGSYIAIGTFDPEIEIWNMDVLEGLYPDHILGASPEAATPVAAESMAVDAPNGAASTASKTKKKKKKSKSVEPAPAPIIDANSYHTDSILSLSWNRTHRQLLASSSADMTVKLWDLTRPSGSPALRAFNDLHQDKVQAVQWNQSDPTVLLSGSWDGIVRVFDSRAPGQGVHVKVESDVECIRWNPWDTAQFLVSMENGLVKAFDSRTLVSTASMATSTKALWTLAAHDKAASALDINPHIPGMLVTGGVDQQVKLWNVDETGTTRKVSLVVSKDLGVGKVFAASFSPDDPTTIAAAGSQGNLQIWDCAGNPGVRRTFGDRLRKLGKALDEQKERVIGVVDDDNSDDDDD